MGPLQTDRLARDSLSFLRHRCGADLPQPERHCAAADALHQQVLVVLGAPIGDDRIHDGAQALRESLGIAHLLLTRSEEGMTLFSAGSAFHVAAQAREVFDVSGAGDTVVAVLAAMLALGRPMTESVALANKAGGIVVGKLGTAAVSPAELFGDEP